MLIPKTFSAPADETFPSLNGYIPSLEDSLRRAVWLMLMADDVNRRAYMRDVTNEDAGVRIYEGRPDYDPQSLSITLPCQIVDVALPDGDWTYSTSEAGTLAVVIAVAHIEAPNSSKIPPGAPTLTAETRLGRISQILMRGTLYREGMETARGRVIDPFLTATSEDDGTYVLPLVYLTDNAPDIRPGRRVTFQNKRAREGSELDQIKDFAVSYALRARFIVNVKSRDARR